MDPKNNITKAAEAVVQLQRTLKKLLDNPELQALNLEMNATAERMLGRLNHLSGQSPTVNTQTKSQEEMYPPITNFLGDKIELPKKVEKKDLNPAKDEKDAFVGRVDKLEKEFVTLDHNGILNSHTTPEDMLVLRGVAKRAGLENFEDAKIDARFVEDIHNALIEREKNKATQDKIDDTLKGKQGNQNLTNAGADDKQASGPGGTTGGPLAGQQAAANTLPGAGNQAQGEVNKTGKEVQKDLTGKDVKK